MNMIQSPPFKFILLASLGSLAVVGCSAKQAEGEKAVELAPIAVQTVKVEQRDIRDSTLVDGNFVVPEGKSAKLAPMVAGRLVSVFVKEGDTVRAGQLIALVDTKVQNAQSKSAQDASSVASAQAKQAQLSYESAKADQKAAVELARQALTTAKAERDSNISLAKTDLDKLKAGARPQEVALAEQAVTQARIARDKAKQESDRDQQLFKEGFVSGQQAQSSKSAFELAESALKQAQSQLDLTKAGSRKEDIDSAVQRLDAAKRLGDLRVAQAETSLKQAIASEKTVQAKAQDAQAANLTVNQRQHESAMTLQVEKSGEIRAPMNGRVVRSLLNAGDEADPTTPVVEIAASGDVIDFVGMVDPSDAIRISVGQAVIFEKFEGLSGTVSSVGVANTQSGLIPVRVRCAQTAKGPTPGTFARAGIILQRLKDALAIPNGAVASREGKDVVFVVKDGVAHLTEIQIGPDDGDWISVTKGIKFGEEVVLLGQHELADGAKVTVAKEPAEAEKAKTTEAP